MSFSTLISFPLEAGVPLSRSSVCLGWSLKQHWLWHFQDQMKQIKSVLFKVPFSTKRISHVSVLLLMFFTAKSALSKISAHEINKNRFLILKREEFICVEARVKHSQKRIISGETLILLGWNPMLQKHNFSAYLNSTITRCTLLYLDESRIQIRCSL